MELSLECKTRPADSKPNALRQSGLIPAVLYGHNGTESVSLTVPQKQAELLIRDASVNNTLVNLDIPEIPWSGKALLREVQSHPYKGTLKHLSFFSVGSQASLDVDVPIHLVGEAPGVKTGGGSLDLQINELRVRCAPDKIVDAINVDISGLNLGGAIHVHELDLPDGVVPLVEKDQIIVAIFGGNASGGSEESA